MDDTSVYGPDCGFTDPSGTAQPIPTDGKATFSRALVHVGPCEIWLDDTKVLSEDDCFSKYGNENQDIKSVFPVDYSSCDNGGCKEMRFYWLAFQGVDSKTVWQSYKDCIPLAGSGGSSTTSTSQTSTTSQTSSTTGADSDTPSSGDSNSPSSGDSNTPSSGDSNTPSSGDSNTPSSGDSNSPSSGDSNTPSSGDSNSPSSGESQNSGTGNSATPAPASTDSQSSSKQTPTWTESPSSSKSWNNWNQAPTTQGSYSDTATVTTAPSFSFRH
ncbi:hypothetical protein PHYPSEUDO_013726 [Phytophthora pseudosyringae]|uniref:Uncharacterized protein n=1 Tax=Phytophthora pseudosyringae TaxID=221518 RepID=A0A8T1V8A8_9STRA|nr:hypothetical protein PHYPSEUDO_013726 [Phytophthora pseudosyringae]